MAALEFIGGDGPICVDGVCAVPDSAPQTWTLWRQDDNGNRVIVSRHTSHEEADRQAAEFDTRSHRQLYWVEQTESA